jgi:hypothetical protein
VRSALLGSGTSPTFDIAAGDYVTIFDNPLSCISSILVHIPALEARGVDVYWDDSGLCIDQGVEIDTKREAISTPSIRSAVESSLWPSLLPRTSMP